MDRVAELKKEALAELIADKEHEVKSKIRCCLNTIVSEQKRIADAMRNIAVAQDTLKSIKLETIDIKL